MLTYRTGAAGKPAIARAMAEHLMEQTLPRDKADLAEYYQRGMAGDGEHTAPQPRRDMHPEVADRLGIDPNRAPTMDEVTNLLNGQQANGGDVPGKSRVRATDSLEGLFGVDPDRLPTKPEIALVLKGHRLDGQALPTDDRESAVRRMFGAFGVEDIRSIKAAEYANILDGRRADGSALDPDDWRQRVTTSKPRIGYIDLCFSADKSVSLAWAFAPTEAERNMIAQAHRDAVDSAMRYIETEIGRARKGDGGKHGAEPGHIGWVTFDHYSSRPTVAIARDDRGALTLSDSMAPDTPYTELVTLKVAGDPNLHTHVATPNLVVTDTGRVGGLDLQRLEGRVKEFGAYYQAHVATNLRRHGIEVALDPETGAARVAAIPDRVRDAFSKRTRDAHEAAREYAAGQGVDWDGLSSEGKVRFLKGGAKGSRKSKADDLGDFAAWAEEARDLGWTHASVVRPDAPKPDLAPEQRHDVAYEASLPLLEKDLQRRSVIAGSDARVAACRGLIASGVEGPQDIDRVTERMRERGVRQDGQATQLVWGRERDVKGQEVTRLTTTLHVTQEKELVRRVREAAKDRSAALTPEQLASAAERSGLRFDGEHGRAQRRMMEALGAGGRVAVAIGAAGMGKTTLLKPLVDAWEADGRTVFGAALAWRQSDALAEAGIGAANRAAVSVFLDRAKSGKLPLDGRSVVVVDELGLLGTRQMLDLMRLQGSHGFQLVALGDPKQCQAIDAGPTIALMRRALGKQAVPEVLSTVRQKGERERQIARLFRDGKAEAALAMKREDKTVQLVAGGYREAVERIAALWQERREANRDTPDFTITVSAPSNADARQISAAIRERRRAMGEIGPDKVTVQATDQIGARYDLALAVGDRVRLFGRVNARFDTGGWGNIGNNGSVLTVTGIGKEGITLRTAAGREGMVKWESLRDGRSGRIRLTYGDAGTIDAQQGITSTEHINALPGGSRTVQGFKAYVAESRHRETAWLVISDGAERQEIVDRRPLGDSRIVRESDVWKNVARNLERQPEKASALAFMQRAHQVQRATARRMQRGLRPAEQRAAEGLRPTVLREAFQRSREREQVRPLARELERSTSLTPVIEALQGLGEEVGRSVSRSFAKQKPALQKVVGFVARERVAKDHIDALKHSVSLTHLIGQTVQLDRHGKGLCPFHEEKTPSFHVDEKKGHYHCLAGETGVITPDGTIPIQKLAGGVHRLLTRGGIWVDAPIRSFGHQRLWKINLSRNGVRKTLYATDGHRWFVRGKTLDTLTSELRTGHRLEAVFPQQNIIEPDFIGIRHGIVFGDGFLNQKHARVGLHGDKVRDLRGYFPCNRTYVYITEGGAPFSLVVGLPTHFKDLPPLDAPLRYLAGFLAGYLATDGHVAEDGTIMLHCKHPDTLEHVRAICMRLGIGTHGVTSQVRVGYGAASEISRIHLVTAHVWPSLVLRSEAAERLANSKKAFGRHRWVVRSVEPTDRIEEVFCATVDGYGAFAIEDNILTGNCFGCGCHGDAVDWLKDGRGMSFPDAIGYLEGRTGITLPPPMVSKRSAATPDWVPVQPVPPGVPPLVQENGWTARVFNPKQAGTDRERKSYRPAHVAAYKDPDGQPMGYVLRVELKDGKKFTPQVTWAVPAGVAVGIDPAKAGRWALVPMNDPRPLYHGEALAKAPDAPVIVVMGEKKADALQAVLGHHAVVVSWAGGDHGRGHVDFSALKGRDVTIWPDADASGKAAAVGEVDQQGRLKRGSADLIQAAGASSVRVIVPPEGVWKGWDAGDLITSGAGRQQVQAFIADRAVSPADAKRVFDRQKQDVPQRTLPRSVPQPLRGPTIDR
ncbi:relaxase domain-containing protein (plasmid) [Skermanella rosea]|uniref:MobF family relaxase n=1 Tax=Skermanella rosea TaxID=1817965 RepID=UPI0019312A7D|nr:MobF family relaxase [Skermanella rosea]UEM08137.1 relaxase domain-containing protein [Skermanella rosea]